MALRSKTKTAERRENRDKRPSAEAKYIRISPSKVRVVLDVVRGKDVAEALAILHNIPKSAAEPVAKLIQSAAANAEHNNQLSSDSLYVAEIFAGEGPTLKRIRPKDHGRAHRILKRTSHIKVILDTKEER